MEDQHMTQQVFADFLQQSPATLSSIFNGRTRPTLNIVDAIKTKIPDISIEWLLYGIGDMYVTHPNASEASDQGAPDSAVAEPMLLFETPAVVPSHPAHVREEVKLVEKEPRKVTEIRVYYDDQTYETFVPAKK